MTTQSSLIRALGRATIGLFLVASVEGVRPLIFSNRAALSTRMRAIRATATTGCIMFVFEVAKQALHPEMSIWTSHNHHYSVHHISSRGGYLRRSQEGKVIPS